MFRNLLLGTTCFALSAIPSPQTSADAPSSQEPGLAAYYPLDEGSGSLARDRSGHGNHGKIRGAQWEKLALGEGLPTPPCRISADRSP